MLLSTENLFANKDECNSTCISFNSVPKKTQSAQHCFFQISNRVGGIFVVDVVKASVGIVVNHDSARHMVSVTARTFGVRLHIMLTPGNGRRVTWDVGHIAHFEELWLTQNLDGPIEFSEMPGMYNPFEHPRATRASLALPSLKEMMGRLAEIRSRVLARLDTVKFDQSNPLLRDAYVYNNVLQHENQHNETILT